MAASSNHYRFAQPTYCQFVTDVSSELIKAWNNLETTDLYPTSWLKTLQREGSCTVQDIVLLVVLSVAWTVVRSVTTKFLFVPIAKNSGLRKKEELKVPESLWKFSFSTVAWLISSYLVLVQYNLFHDPVNATTNWVLHSTVESDIYFVYMFQMTFYIHSVHATLVLDEWRKDSVVLILHHVVTMMLISASYLFRYTYLGILVLFLHDFSDIFLEVTKLAVYYKTKGGRWSNICGVFSTIGFVMFAISWFVFRLYWYPLKAVYACAYISRQVQTAYPPFYFFLNGLMLTLLFLHMYWFKFILVMTFNILSGKSKKVEDTREYKDSPTPDDSFNHVSRNGANVKLD
uniref:Ceramide synthase 1-like n=1 Tax=Ciona intestinalis TaxID=7719 RepID=H2XMY4_CIOIN|nr:ceramide synthase 1-like [Ciona intestinalis]|eukprot:XP_009857563.2 ceramide synthase 1-like [Ciona intestinalis]